MAGIFNPGQARYNFLLAGIVPEDKTQLVEIGRFRLGNVRSLAEDKEFCSVDFCNKTMSEKSLKSGFIENLADYRGIKVKDAASEASKVSAPKPKVANVTAPGISIENRAH